MSEYLEFDPETNVLTVESAERREHLIGSKVLEPGEITLTKNTVVRVRAKRGYKLPKDTPTELKFEVSSVISDDELDKLTTPDSTDDENTDSETQDFDQFQ